MAADKSVGTKRAIWVCVILAVTAGMALAAHAQVMTAPTSTAPVQAPPLSPSAVVTVPYVVAISYPTPGQNPPTAATSFPASALSYSTASPTAAQRAGNASTPASLLDVTTAVSRGVPLPGIPTQTPLTSMTITAYKAGVAVAIMTFMQPVLVSKSYTSAAGAPQESMRFAYTQVTTTYAH